MPYYEAFCLRYEPTTDGGRSQCEGIEAGTVDPITVIRGSLNRPGNHAACLLAQASGDGPACRS